MKKSLFTASLVFVAAIATGCNAQRKVPQVVQEAFTTKFPDAKNVKWDKENASEWEAEFTWNSVKYSVNFLENGTWQETEHKINKSEVPQNVLVSLKENFPGYQIKESEISETSSATLYEFGVKKGGKEMEVAIDQTGKVVKKKAEEEEDDDEE